MQCLVELFHAPQSVFPCKRKMSGGEELLPGIAEDVVLTHIAPKLRWTDLHALACINKTWQRAIQNRQVYNERTRADSAETLVAVKHGSYDWKAISLYSMSEDKFYRLPPLPHPREISRFSQLISSNGVLYVIGTGSDCECWVCTPSPTGKTYCTADRATHKYMLDLAGQGQWKECESVPGPGPVVTQCNIKCIFHMGTKTFVRLGRPGWFRSCWLKHYSRDMHQGWGMVRPFQALDLDKYPQELFTADGKDYKITTYSTNYDLIYHWDENTKTVTHHQFISRVVQPAPGVREEDLRVVPLFIIPVENELLAIASWNTVFSTGHCLIRTRGFGTQRRAIGWQRVNSRHFVDGNSTFAMVPIQL